jgi:uncharacterized repeat protein (TIGR03803 family)
MRFSRFPKVMSVLFALLLLAGVSSSQNVTALHSFSSSGASQGPDFVTPTQGRDGDLFGTTTGLNYSSILNDGSIFRLQTTGEAAAPFSFNGTDGSEPYAGVTLGTDGNFYGTAVAGGSAGYGVLFRVTSDGTYTVLHEFLGASDGMYPRAAPIEGFDGNFYGTTEDGANRLGATVYRYSLAGGFTSIHQFENSTDYFIMAPLIQDSDGNLYGTAYYGANNCGSVFKLTTSGVLLMQQNFACSGITNPASPLLQASDGNYYGTTSGNNGNVSGAVFKMTSEGSVSVVHAFSANGSGGKTPVGGLVQATDGNLYGSTRFGGNAGYGTLYQITTGGKYVHLYSFPSSVGQYPTGSLLQHTNGLLFGTAADGGAYGYGAVYSLDMGLSPFITFVRLSGRTGQTAQILGQGLTGATRISFNGAAASSFTVNSDTYLTAVIPSGATTGKVVVTTPGGTLTSNVNFRIIQ